MREISIYPSPYLLPPGFISPQLNPVFPNIPLYNPAVPVYKQPFPPRPELNYWVSNNNTASSTTTNITPTCNKKATEALLELGNNPRYHNEKW